jgi:LAS superfamily LD-carboxypeptidase LdcB
MDRQDLSQNGRDELGLEVPFREALGEQSNALLSEIGESPFAEGLAAGEEGFEPADEGEMKASPPHSYKDCTDSQRLLLSDVADQALVAVRHAASFIGSAYGRPDRMKPATRQLLLRHFHTTRREDLRHILTRYMRIAKAFEEGIRFEGEKQCISSTAGMVCGYAQMTQLFGGFGSVHICFDSRPGHCDFSTFPLNEQKATVIHEVAHRYVGIDDKAYVHQPAYAKLTPKQALDNADSYAFFAADGVTTLKETYEPEAAIDSALGEDFDAEETLQSEEEALYAEEGDATAAQGESSAEEMEAGFRRCASDESDNEGQEEALAEAPAWSGSAEQIDFRSRVLAAHIANSSGRKQPLRDLRDDELEKIPGTAIKTKTETARAAGRLLAAARTDLAAAKAQGDADALRTTGIGVGSGYRDSADQRHKWLSYFQGYYNRTRAAREQLAGGPHSKAAVDYLLRPESQGGFGLAGRIAAPGFSNHQNGIAIDFIQKRTSLPVAIDTSKANRSRWSKTWFHGWLKRNAATHGFVPYAKEEWHWEYKPNGALAREDEAAGKAVPARPFLGGSIWTYSSRVCATKVAVFVPPAALRSQTVDMMLYVHGLLSPCGVPKIVPEGIISDARFRLGQIVVDSGRPVVLVVPRMQPGNDKSWSAHGLDRADKLNALIAEVLAETGGRLGRAAVQIGKFIVAGHSRAFGVLYPLARSHASPALEAGALARLSKVWVLDATYGSPPMAAFEALAATKPGLAIDIVYRACSSTDKFGGRSRSAPVSLRPVDCRSISHCAVPGNVLPSLMAEPPTEQASREGESAYLEPETMPDGNEYLGGEEGLEEPPGESLNWLDLGASASPEALETEAMQGGSYEPEAEPELSEEGRYEEASTWGEVELTEAPYDEESDSLAEMEMLAELLEGETGANPGLLDKITGLAAFVLGPTLRRGSKGAGTETLQRLLVKQGATLSIDGQFGAGTERAVRGFQGRSGLTADGVAGPRTKQALVAASRGAAPSPVPSGRDLGAEIARIAEQEYQRWHPQSGDLKETDSAAVPILQQYYREGVNQDVTATMLQSQKWQQQHPWSAVFVSWVMRTAGAGANFHYAAAHQSYIRAARQNRLDGNSANPFWAYRATEAAPEVGDLVCRARSGSGATYDNIADPQTRATHCDIVTEVHPGSLRVVGGNKNNNVDTTPRPLRTLPDGRLALDGNQADYFAILRCRGAL